jgi:hypothetical protein
MDCLGERKLSGYNFDRQNKVEDTFTPLIIEYLQKTTGQKPEDERHLRLEHDFRIGLTHYDLKADTLMQGTGNFFIETESVIKKGWFYNQNVDFILYLNTQTMCLYTIPIRALQQHEAEIKQWPYRKISQENAGYWTGGYKVPIQTLSRWLNLKRTNLRLEGKMELFME